VSSEFMAQPNVVRSEDHGAGKAGNLSRLRRECPAACSLPARACLTLPVRYNKGETLFIDGLERTAPRVRGTRDTACAELARAKRFDADPPTSGPT